MPDDEQKRLWDDERNWGDGLFGVYFCKEDPRLVVPKRGLPGGTFNMAHRWAMPLLTGVIVMLIALIVILAFARILG